MDDVIVGMESTGHFWFNMAHWLVQPGIDVVLVNPMTTKRNKVNRDNSPSKSDPKDALVIADAVSRGYYTPFSPEEESFRRIRVWFKTESIGSWNLDALRIESTAG